MSTVDEKQIQRALLHITALDERKRRGAWDEEAERALQNAEQVVLSASGSDLLGAWRRWRDSSVRSFDPTRRTLVPPVQSLRNCTPERTGTQGRVEPGGRSGPLAMSRPVQDDVQDDARVAASSALAHALYAKPRRG